MDQHFLADIAMTFDKPSAWRDRIQFATEVSSSDLFSPRAILERDRVIEASIRKGRLVPSFYMQARAAVQAGIQSGVIRKSNSTSKS
jgi:hypothetical protein